MQSSFFGLEIAKKALFAQQQSLNITGHNIANANTEGYSRQTGVQAATYLNYDSGFGNPTWAGLMGSGVKVEDIRRMRDVFVDHDFRMENRALGEWEARRDALKKIELIFNEPSDNGIRSVFDSFWAAWQELSKTPESLETRAIVYQQGLTLADTINHIYRQFNDMLKQANFTLETKVQDINSIARQIADLNNRIMKVEVTGNNANDLRDKRDLLVDRLSKIVNIVVDEDRYGMYTIAVQGAALVSGTSYSEMAFDADDPDCLVTWKDTGRTVGASSGELKGLLAVRDEIIPFYIDRLKTLSDNLAAEVNGLHRTGYGLRDETTGTDPTGLDFFQTVTGSATELIKVNTDLEDETKIAAASDPDLPGDGSNALAIALLKDKVVTALSSTMDDFTKTMISTLGVDAQEAVRMVDNQNLLISQISHQRASVSGVSLDEEMANMVKFQHAYNAAARMVTAIDEMLDVIVSRMGVVGR